MKKGVVAGRSSLQSSVSCAFCVVPFRSGLFDADPFLTESFDME